MDQAVVSMMLSGVVETLYMTLSSTFLAYIIGLPLGMILVVTSKEGIAPNRAINGILGFVINVTRSIPFIILLILIMPITRIIVGTTLGPSAVIVPLVFAAGPYVARLVEASLKEVDKGVIEAAQAMGTSNFKIATKVLLVEARPSLLQNLAISSTTILGYSTMAGFVGGRGLGDIAVRYGYYRYETLMMIIAVVLIIIIVQILQETFAKIATKIDKRR